MTVAPNFYTVLIALIINTAQLANVRSIVGHLFEKGVIDLQTANKVRVEQSKTNKTEKELLLEMQVVTEEQAVRAQSEMFNIPFVDLNKVVVPEELLSGLNVELLKNLRLMPFEKVGSQIKVAMVNPFDVQAIQSLKVQFKESFQFSIYITTKASLDIVAQRFLGEVISTEVSEALEDVGDMAVTNLDKEEADSLDNAQLLNAPVARIVNSILKYAVQVKASDIHIEPLEEALRVRFRVDGVLIEKLSLPIRTSSSVVARVKILSKLKIDEKRLPQDGRIQLKFEGVQIDVRVSTTPTIYGEKAVLRLLDVSEGVPPIATSGLRGDAYKSLMRSITATHGIILITGPTGSGKTRTLAGALSVLNKPTVNIVTLENPVEIRIPGVTQIQVNPDIGLTFANGLRSILRQDPDIVMVGEIRDKETAHLAVEASLTGHLVLATLHTNTAAAAVGRLLDMQIEGFLIASTLRSIVAQRLPRKICKHCIESYEPPQEVIDDIKNILGGIPGFDLFPYLSKLCQAQQENQNGNNGEQNLKLVCPTKDEQGREKLSLYRGKGCNKCGYKGYSGRLGIFEVLTVSDTIVPLILQNALATDIEKVAMQEGMLQMLQDGYLKALEGQTTIEEVLRVAQD